MHAQLEPALRFLDQADEERFADCLRDDGEAEYDPGILAVARRLHPAANDSLSDLVIVGWAKGALDLVLEDHYLKQKGTVWLVQPGQLPHLARALAARSAETAHIRIAVCERPGQIPYVLSLLPLCWSYAALDAGLVEPQEVLRQAGQRFLRTIMPPHRVFGDLRHLLSRGEHLGEGIAMNHWKGAYAGQTALCIAAGPSLDAHLDLVRRVQDRCVVIVVDVVHRRLQQRGIKVDFTLNVDSSDCIPELLGGSSDPHSVLVCPINGHRGVDERFPRRSYFTGDPYTEWVVGGDHTFRKGTTVGIATVGFAHYLGCREVVLVGHDLAFKADSYYSSCADGKSLEAINRPISNRSVRTIPGNDGGMVTTDLLFQIGVDDLSILLRAWKDDLTVYNPNINAKIGARIENTLPLSGDWDPLAKAPLPRPAAGPTLGSLGAVERLKELPRTLVESARGLADYWREQRHRDPTQFSHLTIPRDPFLTLAFSPMALFERGLTYHMVRLQALPPSITLADHHREFEAFAEQVDEAAIDLLKRACDLEQDPFAIDEKLIRDTGLSAAQFNELFARIALEPEFSMDNAMLPNLAQCYHNLRHGLPQVGMPAPHSANEGLMLCQSLGLLIPRRFLIQTLCLCVMEDEAYFAPCLDWARRHGVLTPDQLTVDALPAPHDRGEPQPWLDAAAAVIAIRHEADGGLASTAARALTWHPCRLYLLRALLNRGPIGIEVLEQLIDAGDLPLDDQLAALVLLNHPDVARAVAIISPRLKELGEATTMAIAHREEQRGNWNGALSQVASVRPLSRFRDQALVIACRCHLAMGKVHLVSECAAQLVDERLRKHWERFLPEADEDASPA